MSTNERGKTTPDVSEIILQALRSKELGSALEQKSPEERSQYILELAAEIAKLHQRYSRLEHPITPRQIVTKQEKQYDISPQFVIAIQCRNGRYLDLSKFPEDALPMPKPSGDGFRDLYELYKNHIKIYGENSIAHICPDIVFMSDLIVGLAEGYPGSDRIIRINTIDELQELRDRLDQTPDSRLYYVLRNAPGHLRTSAQPTTITRFVRSKATRLLDAWDAIGEEPQI